MATLFDAGAVQRRIKESGQASVMRIRAKGPQGKRFYG